MAKSNKDTSILFWMLALFILAIPCIGAVMIIIWAIWGGNGSRKNFFRAIILWFVLLWVLWFLFMVFGFWPQIQAFFIQKVQYLATQIQHLKR